MGKYINETANGPLGATYQEKLEGLYFDEATPIDTPTEWQEGLVCVVNNGMFGAAGYAYDEREMRVFLNPEDKRRKTWMYYEKAHIYAR